MSRPNIIAWIGMFCYGLFIGTLIAIKVAGMVCWSWWWILAPIWIPLVLVTLLILLAVTTPCDCYDSEGGFDEP